MFADYSIPTPSGLNVLLGLLYFGPLVSLSDFFPFPSLLFLKLTFGGWGEGLRLTVAEKVPGVPSAVSAIRLLRL